MFRFFASRDDFRTGNDGNYLNHIENLIFQGGGVKGVAYLGALTALFDQTNRDFITLPNIKRVAGTSAGAITALLVALGYEVPDELVNEIATRNFTAFLDEWRVIDANWTTKSVVLTTIDIFNCIESNRLSANDIGHVAIRNFEALKISL